MGSFSWLRADKTTKRCNLTIEDSYRILVPTEFGGGYIRDTYLDYGYINHYGKAIYVDGNKHRYPLGAEVVADLYGVLAYWNVPELTETIKSLSDENIPDMLKILKYGDTSKQETRCKGIDIGCYDEQVDELKYPLKLVSASYTETYENCDMRSYGDPEQGFYKTYWD